MTFRHSAAFVAWSPIDNRLALADSELIAPREGYVASIYMCNVGQNTCSIVWQKTGEQVGGFHGMDWSPISEQILFSLGTAEKEGTQADLYTLDIDSGNVNRLTFTETDETNAVWSPDGKWLAYIQRDSASTRLVVSTASLDCVLNVAESTSGGLASPAWSPDGERLAFIKQGSILLIEMDRILSSNKR